MPQPPFEIISISKTLSNNDLGLTGSHQAGITVPKSGPMLSFFPNLPPEYANPRLSLDAFDEVLGSRIPLNYIYYNGKVHGTNTRNEYRITGLTQFFKLHDAHVGDEIRFSKIEHGLLGIAVIAQTIQETQDAADDSPVRIKLSGNWSTYRRTRE
ncbi:EcoRII N-terminal effector-binding domain-containing protein [Arthrobacter sp. YD4]|uniref:EcoRII N-terminal effector-binding domain-containing protein n=1 Tax=Arthrobacter sp. YD4 TaxID=3058043 RepID=UPI0025B3EEC0|nr:EcoRII N-terminal effector-binding domain-containing protein [Arthrobacter sp. YD4]MDN3937544.1 EcoRII N-terminal effector-binding domain-containing protein [Arthrobacter sp. YD4]